MGHSITHHVLSITRVHYKVAPLKHTRSKNKLLVGRIPNGRNTQWSPDEKQALLDAIKDEKMQNNKFKPSARLDMEEDT